MYKFNTSKYNRAEEALAYLRKGTSGIARATVSQSVGDKTWDADTAASQSVEVGKGGNSMMLTKKMRDYLSNSCVGASYSLISDTIGVSYMVVGDVDRKPALGENTSGIKGEFEWTNMVCDISLHAGEMVRLNPMVATQHIISMHANDAKKVQQSSGWSMALTNTMGPEDIHTFENLVSAAAAGTSKFTRLVKGMLIYVDLLHGGSQRLSGDLNNMLDYEPGPVLGSFRAQNRSYAYCSKTASKAYCVLMHLIGIEYPPRWGGYTGQGNVAIPADSEDHYLVCYDRMTPGRFTCTMTEQLVWIGMVNYAKEMGVADQLEEALIVACSLHDNRYLSKASLPRVESTIDLIRPVFSMPNTDDNFKPVIDKDMSVIIGRTHQMSCLLLAKDLIVGAQASSTQGYNFTRVLRSHLSSQEQDLIRMSQGMCEVPLVAGTSRMRWLGLLDDGDIGDLGSMSLLECMWLASPKCRSVSKGGIDLLVRGKNDMMVSNGYAELLVRECAKLGITYNRNKLPCGKFSLMSRCLYTVEQWEGPNIEFEEFEVVLDQDCDYKAEDFVEVPKIRRRKDKTVVMPSLDEHIRSASIGYSEDSVVAAMLASANNEKWKERGEEEREKEREKSIVASSSRARSKRPVMAKRAQRVSLAELGVSSDTVLGHIDVSEVQRINVRKRKSPSGTVKPSLRVDRTLDDPSQTTGRTVSIGSEEAVSEVRQLGEWVKKPEISASDKEKEMYSDPVRNKELIIQSGEPLTQDRKEIWEDLRMEALMSGRIIVPSTPLERALVNKKTYDGLVDIDWVQSGYIGGLSEMPGWEKTLKNRGFVLDEKIFGDNKPFYYGFLVEKRNWGWEDLRWLENNYTDTTVNLSPDTEALDILRRKDMPTRPFKGGDSSTSTRKTLNDSKLASALVEMPEIAEYLSSKQIKSLKNVYQFNKFELAKMRRETLES